MTPPERRPAAGVVLGPSFAPLVEARAGSEDAIDRLLREHEPLIRQGLREGRARHGDFGLDARALLVAVARAAIEVAEAEKRAGGRPTPEGVLATLLPAELYLAEALCRGVPAAWSAFEDVLEASFRSVRSHLGGRASRTIMREIRESILGTFFLDRKVDTYRGTAPLGAWARQVIFNLFRQRLHLRKTGRETPAFSQIGAQDDDIESLLPAAREPPPPEMLDRDEWTAALARVVPEAFRDLDPVERRMLEVLPTKIMSQVKLCRELGISPFKLNRWYKDVRRRFLRGVALRLKADCDLDELQAERLIGYLAGLWGPSVQPEIPPISRKEEEPDDP